MGRPADAEWIRLIWYCSLVEKETAFTNKGRRFCDSSLIGQEQGNKANSQRYEVDSCAEAFVANHAILKVHPFVKIGMSQKKKGWFAREKTLPKQENRQSTGVFGSQKRSGIFFLIRGLLLAGVFFVHINTVFAVDNASSGDPCRGASMDIAQCFSSGGWYKFDAGKSLDNATNTVTDTVTSGAKSLANSILIAIITFLGWVTTAAAALLSWSLNPQLLYDLLQNALVYQWWQMVRDILNIFFIGVLLLSAFSTIFQIDRYHYKKILLNLIIMALLVNFSFPIARFVIEFANRLMYFFMSLSQVASNGANLTNFGDIFLGQSKIIDVLVKPAKETEAPSVLIAGIIMLFLFAIALLTIAVLMLVRVVALILVVIFSPIGFVGQIVPGMGGYASKWWNHLFRYAFFGPAAVFMLTLSMAMMQALNMSAGGLKSEIAKNADGTAATGYLSSIAENIALEVIPIIMIYMTIGIGSTMSIQFAKKIEEKGEKFARGVGKWALGTGLAVGTLGGYSFAKNAKDGWDDYRKQVAADRANRWGKKFGKTVASIPDKPLKGERFQFNRDAARRLKVKKDAERNDRVKQNEETQRSYKELIHDLETGNELTKEAAALSLANKKDFRSDKDLLLALNSTTDATVLKKIISGAPEHAFGNPEVFARAFTHIKDEPAAVRELIGKASSYTFKEMKVETYRTLKGMADEVNAGDSLDSRMKDNKGAHVLVEANGGDYSVVVEKMNISQLANQGDKFYSDPEKLAAAMKATKNINKDQQQSMFRTAGEKGNNKATKFLEGYFSDTKEKDSKSSPIIDLSGQSPSKIRSEQNKSGNK